MRPLRLQYNAPVVLTFSLLSLGALIFGMLTGGGSTRLLFCVYRAPLTDPLTYVRMFTHVLGHANYTHFIGNIMLLLVTALISGLVQFLLFPGSALLGASGIVFMMIVLSSLAGMREGEVPLTLVLVVLLYLGGEVVDAATARDSVSQLTHIVGGLCGAGLGFAMGRGRRI